MQDLAYLDLRLTTAELSEGTFVVTATGELDVWSARAFESELQAPLDRGAERLVVELTAVPLIDSIVLGILMRTAKRLRARGGELLLVADDPRTVRVIEITGLSYLFTIVPSLTEAVARVTKDHNGHA